MKKFKDLKVGDFIYSISIYDKEILLTKEKILDIRPDEYNEEFPKEKIYEICTDNSESGGCLLEESEFDYSYLPVECASNGTFCADLDAVREVFRSWILTIDDLENEIKKLD